MKRKVPKSLQAILITLIVGMFLPKVMDITGISLVDKVIIRGLLTLAFNVSTILVGILYSANLLHGKKEGGKARIIIYTVLVAILMLCIATSVLSFTKEVGKVLLIVLNVASLVLIALLILSICSSIRERKKQFKISQQQSVNQKGARYARTIPTSKGVISKANSQSSNNNRTSPQFVEEVESQIQDPDPSESELNKKTLSPTLKTIYQLWNEKDPAEKCLTVTNDDNPDLKWVKIYKPPYGDGKFYGYIKMMDARNTVNGEIYFADEPIWMLYKE